MVAVRAHGVNTRFNVTDGEFATVSGFDNEVGLRGGSTGQRDASPAQGKAALVVEHDSADPAWFFGRRRLRSCLQKPKLEKVDRNNRLQHVL